MPKSKKQKKKSPNKASSDSAMYTETPELPIEVTTVEEVDQDFGLLGSDGIEDPEAVKIGEESLNGTGSAGRIDDDSKELWNDKRMRELKNYGLTESEQDYEMRMDAQETPFGNTFRTRAEEMNKGKSLWEGESKEASYPRTISNSILQKTKRPSDSTPNTTPVYTNSGKDNRYYGSSLDDKDVNANRRKGYNNHFNKKENEDNEDESVSASEDKTSAIAYMESLSKNFRNKSEIGSNTEKVDKLTATKMVENMLARNNGVFPTLTKEDKELLEDMEDGTPISNSAGMLTGNILEDLATLGLRENMVGYLMLGLAYGVSFYSKSSVKRVAEFQEWDDIYVTYKQNDRIFVPGSEKAHKGAYCGGNRGVEDQYRKIYLGNYSKSSDEDVAKLMSHYNGKKNTFTWHFFHLCCAHQVRPLKGKNFKSYFMSKRVPCGELEFDNCPSVLDALMVGIPKILDNIRIITKLNMGSDWMRYHCSFSNIGIDLMKIFNSLSRESIRGMLNEYTYIAIQNAAENCYDEDSCRRVPSIAKAFLYSYHLENGSLPKNEYYGPKRFYDEGGEQTKKMLTKYSQLAITEITNSVNDDGWFNKMKLSGIPEGRRL